MSLIIAESTAEIGTITLNHAAKRNALSIALIDEIHNALAEFRARQLRVVVLRAPTGCKVWSAGHDISELPDGGRDPLGWGDPLRVLVRALQEFPAPIIALIEGSVWGGGCEIAMSCDLLVATPEATFAITPAKLGIPYNLSGILTLMNAIPLPVAKQLLFTAQPIGAAQLLNLGVINFIQAAGAIDEFVYALADQICANAPLSIAVMKEELRLLGSAHSLTPEVFEKMQGLRRIVYDSRDYVEGIAAIREKRKAKFTGR